MKVYYVAVNDPECFTPVAWYFFETRAQAERERLEALFQKYRKEWPEVGEAEFCEEVVRKQCYGHDPRYGWSEVGTDGSLYFTYVGNVETFD